MTTQINQSSAALLGILGIAIALCCGVSAALAVALRPLHNPHTPLPNNNPYSMTCTECSLLDSPLVMSVVIDGEDNATRHLPLAHGAQPLAWSSHQSAAMRATVRF